MEKNVPGLNSVTVQPRAGKAAHLVIFLHGYGADRNDLIGLGDGLGAGRPDCAFVSVDAPYPCEMGFGRQWFSLADRSPAVLSAATKAVLPLFEQFLQAELTRWTLPSRDVALIGFSQGTMMALAAGLARSEALGGIIGFSGALLETGAIASKPPVLLVHGKADPVVPFTAMEQARAALQRHGVSVESLARPGLGHGIDAAGLDAAAGFLDKIWG